ncbi:MAG: class IIb bacteriocin, lactobin A/cerein 7B family [Acutalibacteraceae bacterium]|nr:class IIb bacteriocin, lactobin A/cerein 7B family [Acutalibacteraceae bacterium]
MNIDNRFLALSDNEMEEVNGGIGFGVACLIGAGGVLVISAAVSAFNGYQEEKWNNRKK